MCSRDLFPETATSPGQSLQQEMELEAWSRQETSSGSTEWHILVAMKMQHSDLLLWEIAISSCCPSGPSTTLMPRPCLPRAVPSVLRRAHPVRCRTPPRRTLLQGLPIGLNLSWNLTVVWDSSYPLSFHRGIPLLQSKNSPCLSCSILQEISCTSNRILVSVPRQTQTNVCGNSLSSQLSTVTL